MPIDHRATDFFGALNMSFDQKFRVNKLVSSWSDRNIAIENERKYHLKDNCFDLAGGEIILVLQIEETGMVSEVYSSKQNMKASCFTNTYKGLLLPKPPVSPFYHLWRML